MLDLSLLQVLLSSHLSLHHPSLEPLVLLLSLPHSSLLLVLVLVHHHTLPGLERSRFLHGVVLRRVLVGRGLVIVVHGVVVVLGGGLLQSPLFDLIVFALHEFVPQVFHYGFASFFNDRSPDGLHWVSLHLQGLQFLVVSHQWRQRIHIVVRQVEQVQVGQEVDKGNRNEGDLVPAQVENLQLRGLFAAELRHRVYLVHVQMQLLQRRDVLDNVRNFLDLVCIQGQERQVWQVHVSPPNALIPKEVHQLVVAKLQ